MPCDTGKHEQTILYLGKDAWSQHICLNMKLLIALMMMPSLLYHTGGTGTPQFSNMAEELECFSPSQAASNSWFFSGGRLFPKNSSCFFFTRPQG